MKWKITYYKIFGFKFWTVVEMEQDDSVLTDNPPKEVQAFMRD